MKDDFSEEKGHVCHYCKKRFYTREEVERLLLGDTCVCRVCWNKIKDLPSTPCTKCGKPMKVGDKGTYGYCIECWENTPRCVINLIQFWIGTYPIKILTQVMHVLKTDNGSDPYTSIHLCAFYGLTPLTLTLPLMEKGDS